MSKQKIESPDIFAERRNELSELAQLAQDDQDRAYIAEQQADLKLAEDMQAEANMHLQRQQQIGRASLKNTVEVINPAEKREVTRDDIAWLSEKKIVVPLERRMTPLGKPFLWGRLTEFSNRTQVDAQTFPNHVMENIEETLLRHVSNKIEAPDHRTRDLRPLEPSITREHTSFNPYKDDNVGGLKANDVRALILEDGTNREEPIYYIAAVCKHAEQQQLIYGL